jgi:hypothetical protein
MRVHHRGARAQRQAATLHKKGAALSQKPAGLYLARWNLADFFGDDAAFRGDVGPTWHNAFAAM